nr:uncharacterized protein LOC125183707 [Anser cygnoides]
MLPAHPMHPTCSRRLQEEWSGLGSRAESPAGSPGPARDPAIIFCKSRPCKDTSACTPGCAYALPRLLRADGRSSHEDSDPTATAWGRRGRALRSTCSPTQEARSPGCLRLAGRLFAGSSHGCGKQLGWERVTVLPGLAAACQAPRKHGPGERAALASHPLCALLGSKISPTSAGVGRAYVNVEGSYQEEQMHKANVLIPVLG